MLIYAISDQFVSDVLRKQNFKKKTLTDSDISIQPSSDDSSYESESISYDNVSNYLKIVYQAGSLTDGLPRIFANSLISEG